MFKHRNLMALGLLTAALSLASALSACSPATPSPTVVPPAAPAPRTEAPKIAQTAAPAPKTKATTAAPPAAAPKTKARTVAEIATLELGPERQKILEQGARDEGEVMLYTTSTGLEPVAAAFMKRYPFVKMEVFRANTPSLIERTRAEATAGKLGGDVVSGGLRSFMPLADFLVPFKSPEADFSVYSKGAVNHITFITFGYNTKAVAPADVPRKFDDLLLPRWKGKIGFHAPPNTFPALITAALIETMGEDKTRDYLKRLGEQNLFLYQTGGVGMQALISGETHIGTQSHASVVDGKKSGAPVNFVALDPTMATVSLIGVFEKTAHPHAAMLFIDFMISSEGHKVLREEGNYASMEEVKQGEAWGVKLPKKVRLESPDDEKNIKKWSDMFNQLAAKKK